MTFHILLNCHLNSIWNKCALPPPKPNLPPVDPLDPLDPPLKKNFEILGGLFDPLPEKKVRDIYGGAAVEWSKKVESYIFLIY